jgi:hypothetical protein
MLSERMEPKPWFEIDTAGAAEEIQWTQFHQALSYVAVVNLHTSSLPFRIRACALVPGAHS